MNNWMVEEIRNEVLSMIRMYSRAVKRCEDESKNFKDVYNTFDKFEATKNEYWRSRAIANKEFLDDLQALLETINDMFEEEIRETEEAEEFDRDLRRGTY